MIALGLADLATAQRADLLASVSIYNQDGQRLLEQYGPVHRIVLPDVPGSPVTPGAPVLAREHAVNVYDQGRPSDGSAIVADQVTQSTVGARVIGSDTEVDVRTTSTTFDWTASGQPLTVTRENGASDITTKTAYDAQARPVRIDMPSAVANSRTNGADSSFTTYYAAGAGSPCTSTILDGLVCQSGPGGAITGGGSNPTQRITTTTTYTELGLLDTIADAANSSTRTTDTDYDGAGRVTLVTVTGGVGAAVPTASPTYSTTTGRVLTSVDTSVSPNPPTITRAYDTLGRLSSYIDADGGKTETTYTWLDQVASTKQYSNPAAPTVPNITTYGYSTDRQLLTSLVDPLAGTFNATYDPVGQLISQAMPGGVALAQAEDPTGSWITRTYTGNGSPYSGTLLGETVVENIHGQWRTRVRGDNLTFGTNQRYDYDLVGRLTQALDTTASATGSTCVRRDYTFTGDGGLNTNRTGYAETSLTSGKDSAASCPASPGSTVSSTYDTADRITNSGYLYDAHGRTSTAPLPAGTASIDYYRTDMVQRQTIGTNRQTWTLDPGMRLRGWTTETNNGTWTQTAAKTNHYPGDGGGGDSPTWINESGSSVTRNVTGIAGDLAAYTDAATANVFWLQLTTLHGDVGQALHYTSATTSDSALAYDTTEYGAKKTGTTGPAYGRYAWLGGKQRSIETVANSLILMGVRLYNPATGRFLSTDPIVGGSANAYDYAGQDPINSFDLDGKCKKGFGWACKAGTATKKFIKKHCKGVGGVGACVVIGGVAIAALSALALAGAIGLVGALAGAFEVAIAIFVGGIIVGAVIALVGGLIVTAQKLSDGSYRRTYYNPRPADPWQM
ncbi:RHS repeat-associated core domain-containing protein [Sporichthya sp.]|uniref:RHS repeat-associated core domain-containing protein n=1 Tax=Sporichthya sp. TaxID=65475 RepID=UPI0017A1B807|nr:RHS repeat-associated core domain-containing protein [Sporichthya sp.]MBA3743586.1 hypothetical protein [Sporichthya sp.]